MKRARIVQPSKPFVIDVVGIPEAPPGGLVVKTAFCGICHSDLHQWEDVIDFGDAKVPMSSFPYFGLPVVPGHEIAGYVYSLGPDQTSDELRLGDRVVIYPWGGCGKCGYCNHNESYKCLTRSRLIGLTLPGGYASYVSVPETKFVIKVPESIPLDIACMLPCSGLTTYNSATIIKPIVENATKNEGEASVLIVGAGGLGLWCLQIAKAILPSTTWIVVADISEDSLAVARKLGCHDTVLWTRDGNEQDIVKRTLETSRNGSFHAIIDFVNSTTTAERNLGLLRPFGILVMVGLFGGSAKFRLPAIASNSKQIKGVYVGSSQQLRELIQLVSKHKVIAPPRRHFKLEEATEAMRLLQTGKMKGRGILKCDQESPHV